jgi:hypothetical protein
VRHLNYFYLQKFFEFDRTEEKKKMTHPPTSAMTKLSLISLFGTIAIGASIALTGELARAQFSPPQETSPIAQGPGQRNGGITGLSGCYETKNAPGFPYSKLIFDMKANETDTEDDLDSNCDRDRTSCQGSLTRFDPTGKRLPKVEYSALGANEAIGFGSISIKDKKAGQQGTVLWIVASSSHPSEARWQGFVVSSGSPIGGPFAAFKRCAD